MHLDRVELEFDISKYHSAQMALRSTNFSMKIDTRRQLPFTHRQFYVDDGRLGRVFKVATLWSEL